MKKKYTEMFCNSELSQHLVKKIRHISRKNIKIMEVCGTHTVSIFRTGIRSLLPITVSLCSGPGCPVCVTAQKEIDLFITLSRLKNVIITTFGDLIRVPGTTSTLQREKANGADIRIVYSTLDALNIAKKNKNKKVVFIGVGFETTAPTVAAAVISAKRLGIYNFYVVSAHKIVSPALEALASSDKINIDGFILPGHVSVIVGVDSYKPFLEKHKIPCVISGFESTELLGAILVLINQIEKKMPQLANAYKSVVTQKGNLKAMKLLSEVFEVVDADWRGIGKIKKSGLNFKDKYSMFDAQKVFNIKYENSSEPKGCSCGDVLMGIKTPPQCKLYRNICTPITPIGPCMVSSEGTCGAYYRYNNDYCSFP